MSRFTPLLALALAVTFSATLAGCESMRKDKSDEGTTETRVQMDAVPAEVRDAFRKAYPGAQLSEVEREVYANGTVHYAFEFTLDGKKMKVELDGEVLPEH